MPADPKLRMLVAASSAVLSKLPMILRLARGVTIAPQYAGADVDCRLLFTGDRNRKLLRTYPEVIHGAGGRG
jgi:hypothetical protein